MPSTFTPTLLLEKAADGEDDNSWGVIERANLDKIDVAMNWQTVGYQVFVTSQSTVNFPLPSIYNRFMLTWQDFVGAAPGGIYVRFSVDGGVTFLSTTEYTFVSSTVTGNATALNAQVNWSDGPLSPDLTAGSTFGALEFSAFGNKMGRAHCHGGLSNGALFMTTTGISCGGASQATHIQLGYAFTTCVSGRVKLLGSL